MSTRRRLLFRGAAALSALGFLGGCVYAPDYSEDNDVNRGRGRRRQQPPPRRRRRRWW